MSGGDFSTELRVRFSETDLQGHVFFGNYLDYFDVALVEYQKAVGYPYPRMVEEGVDMVYVEAVSRFHAPARFDDLLRVSCRVGHLGNTSLRFDFEAERAEDGARIASGSITGVCLDHATRKPVPVPDALRRAAGGEGTTRRLTAVVQREEGAGYFAHCPELDIASQGESPEEARRNLQEAMEHFLASADPAEVRHRLDTEVHVTRIDLTVDPPGRSQEGIPE